MTKSIVLVHGAWHTGECWNAVKELLTQKGYTVYCPTYPGNAAGDSTDIVPSDYSNWMKQVIEEIPEKVIVVGHSSAGLILTEALPEVKDKVELAIYNNAFVPPNGMSQFDCIGPEIEAAFRAIAASREDHCVVLEPGFVREKLMNLADEKTFQLLLDEYVVPQPLAIFDLKVQTNRFIESGIPCAMLHCTDDASVAPNQYREMFESIGRGTVVEIPGEHELLFSDPAAWTGGLLQILE